MLSAVTRLFPLWALLLSVLAYYTPTTFTGIGPWVTTLLMLIMLGMGVVGVWLGMVLDWAVRGALFYWRMVSGRWLWKYPKVPRDHT